MSGFQLKPKVPSAKVVVVPISLLLPLESITLRVTGTPVMLIGIACCWYTAPINWVILSSETAGSPLGKFAATSSCYEPADTSVTVPVIVIVVPVVTPTLGAVTVILLGPFPKAYVRPSHWFGATMVPPAMLSCLYCPFICQINWPVLALIAYKASPLNRGDCSVSNLENIEFVNSLNKKLSRLIFYFPI